MSTLALVDELLLIFGQIGLGFKADEAVRALSKQFVIAGEPLRDDQIEGLRVLAERIERGARDDHPCTFRFD